MRDFVYTALTVIGIAGHGYRRGVRVRRQGLFRRRR